VSDARNALGLGTDIISPPGFEGFFEEVDMLARRGLPDMDQVVALAGKYGVEFLAPSAGLARTTEVRLQLEVSPGGWVVLGPLQTVGAAAQVP
jgi:hypothetical protein